MKENDYVFSLINGIGIIKKMVLDTATVLYENGEEIEENFYDLTKISDNAINIIKSGSFYDMLPEISIERAEDILDQNRIEKIAIMDSNLSATVNGSQLQKYRVTVTFSQKGFRSNCTCPVQTANCKHVAATLIELSNRLNKLNPIDNRSSSLKEYVDEIKSRLNTRNNLNTLDSFSYYLNECDILDLKNELDNIERIADNNKLQIIVSMIFFNMHTHIIFDDILFNYPRINSILRRLKNDEHIYYEINDDKYLKKTDCFQSRIISYIANQKYNKLFLLTMNSSKDIDIYSEFLLDKITIDKKLIDSVFSSYMSNYWSFDLVKKNMYEKVDTDLKIYIIEKYQPTFLNLDDFSLLPYAKQIDFISCLGETRDALKLLINNYYVYYDLDPKRLFEVILIYYDLGTKFDKNKILELMSKDKESIYIAYLLDRNKVNITVFNPYAFFRYYDYKVKIFNDQQTGKVRVTITVYLRNMIVLTLNYDGIFTFSSRYDKQFLDKYENEIYQFVKENYPNFEEEYNSKYEEVRIIQERIKKKEYLSKIRDFKSILNKNIKSLVNKVSIEYEFNKVVSYRNYKTSFEMGLRVGINKYYIVKNIKEFLLYIDNNSYFQYGKELEFNHNIDNFNDNEKDVLNYLLSLPYDDYDISNNRRLLLPKKAFEAILNLLKGRNVNYNGNDYLVRLDEIKPDISIDDNYILKSNIDKDNLLELKDLYYIDNDNHIIDKILSNDNCKDLISFAGDNNNMDLSIVKKEFMDDIYPNFIDYINLPDVIRNEYLDNLIRIEAYFDYQNGKITCDTKVYKKDALLTSDTFMNSSDKAKFIRYTNYLKDLGFIELKELRDQRLILQFFNLDFSELRRICDVYLSDTIQNKTVAKLVTPSIRIQYENNIMEAFLEESEYSEEELTLIMKAIRQKKNFVLLDNDRIIDLNDNESNEFYEAVDDLRLDIKNLYKKQRIETYDALKAYAYLDNCSIDDYISKMVLDIKNFKSLDIKLPNLSEGTRLRKYQKEAYKWISILSKYHMGGILADDMGLGKTLEVITSIKADMNELPSLIVCPKSLLFNWYTEFEKFDGETDVRMIYGNSDIRKNRILGINPEKKVIYITAYDSLRNDIELYQNINFNYLILDEAQNIKNVTALKSVAVKSLDANHRFALTGTPIENNIIDLWSIFDFVMPGYLQDLNIFKARYLNNEAFNEIIKKKVAPFILRRTKEEVLKDLPEKYERIVSCDMSKNQRKIYDAHINDAKTKLDSGASIEVLAYLTRLRQICVAPKLFIEECMPESGKLDYLRELIPSYINDGHKILIFSSFVGGLNLIADLLKELDIKYFMLTGDTKLEQRKLETDEFNKNDDIKVYLISLKAGGTGLNLVGADTVIHLDPWWNVSAENQASDRAHRIGQTRNVEVIKLVASESIEERVIELQNIKKKVIEDIISDNDKSITGFTLEDLKFILS